MQYINRFKPLGEAPVLMVKDGLSDIIKGASEPVSPRRDAILTVDEYIQNKRFYQGRLVAVKGKLVEYEMDSGLARSDVLLTLEGAEWKMGVGCYLSRLHGEHRMLDTDLQTNLGHENMVEIDGTTKMMRTLTTASYTWTFKNQ